MVAQLLPLHLAAELRCHLGSQVAEGDGGALCNAPPHVGHRDAPPANVKRRHHLQHNTQMDVMEIFNWVITHDSPTNTFSE